MANAPTATKPPAAPEQETAGGSRPLSETELRVMHELMARAARAQSAHAPAVRIGEPYVALTNLAVPRRNDPEHKTDLVLKGETVYLTPEEAALLMRCDPRRDGRRMPAIRKLNASPEDDAAVTPRAMSGAPFGPPVEARPDPAGSSFIEVRNIPEATPPVPGSEATAGQEDYAANSRKVVDALDLPPTRSAAAEMRQQADPALMAGLKAGVQEHEARVTGNRRRS